MIELLVVVVILGVITTVALKSLSGVNDIARTEETRKELDQLAWAIAGDPALVSGGVRTDFGYVGDVGDLPPDLDALVSNPGGYSTWDGPYVLDDFYAATGDPETEFKVDAWGRTYSYTGGITISSTGGGISLTRALANSPASLLYNTVSVTVTDLDNSPPGSTYRDSVRLLLSYPNGAGGITTKSVYPGSDGLAEVDSVPVGRHLLRMVYEPENDTLTRFVSLHPGQHYYGEIQYFADVWGAGGSGPGPGVETLRPIGTGSQTNLLAIACLFNNWACVDEEVGDGSITTVAELGLNWRTDTYSTDDASTGSGTVDSVTVFMNCSRVVFSEARTALRTHGTTYYGSTVSPPSGSYAVYSTTYTENPSTSSAWTWTEIDDMEIGVSLRYLGVCTQVWAEVYHTP